MAQTPAAPLPADPPSTGFLPAPVDQLVARLPRLLEKLDHSGFRNAGILQDAIRDVDTIPSFLADEIRRSAAPARPEEMRSFLRMLTSAWPSALRHDLASYSLQLSRHVEQQRPSRYALDRASQCLLKTCRFLPSIAEVLDELIAAHGQIRQAVRALDDLPGHTARAQSRLTAELKGAEEEKAEYEARLARFKADRAAEAERDT